MRRRDVPDIVIDAGQTGVRVGLAYAGHVVSRHEVAGLAYRGRQRDTVLSALTDARPGLAPAGPVGTVCLGLTSVLGDDSEYADFASTLGEEFAAERVLLAGDVVTAHAGALGMRPGVVLSAGTGTVALGISGDGRCRQVDGWGHLLGDAGGGFWIGRRGLDAALREHDGRMPVGPLATRAGEHFGDLDTLVERIYPRPGAVAAIAGFAPEVLAVADQDPNGPAGEILAAAAAELAGTAAAACPPDEPDEPDQPGGPQLAVSWTGRLLCHDGLRRRFIAELARRKPRARPAPAAGDGLTGAARLAAADDLAGYADLVRVWQR